MNEVSEYLKDSPDYYIDWWDNIITHLGEVKLKVDDLVSNLDLVEFYNLPKIEAKNWKIIFLDKKYWFELWRNFYVDKNDWYWYLIRSFLWEWIKKFNWCWKTIYILTALEALKNNKTFVSDISRSTTVDGKYIWNSLVNLWLAKYDEDIKRFKFINNMLEDYFPDKIKNTD